MLGLTQDYITPFALVLGATIRQIGFLASVPSLATSFSQFIAPYATDKAGSRKGFILPIVFAHALIWILVLFLPHLHLAREVWWLIGVITISTVLGSMVNPAWGSMMADLVPEGLRGRYFGLRGRVCGLVAFVFFIIGGVVLHFSASHILVGFSVIFGGAGLFRLASWYLLSRMHEPPLRRRSMGQSLFSIARSMGSTNLGRFTIYVSLMYLSVYLAAPFFAAYMLSDLGFDYITYVGITAAGTLSNLLFLTFWGRRSDRAGNIRVIRLTSVLIPLVPMLWLVGHHLYYLVVVQIVSGFAWSGFILGTTNFVYDAAAPENRTRCIALFGAMNAAAMCLGPLVGGFLAPYLPPLGGYSLLTLFLISGVLRGVVAATLLRRITEVRQVPRVGMAELLLGKRGVAGSKLSAPMLRVFHRGTRVKDAVGLLSDKHSADWEQDQGVASRSPPP
jgi:MFS family permease